MFPEMWLQSPRSLIYRGVERAERALTKSEQLERRIEDVELLERQVAQLTLFSRAVWELAKERLGCTDAEVLARMQALDARADAAAANQAPPRTCAACQRTVSSRHSRCLYCGEPMPPAAPTLP
ncbi:MAG: hypothetical protein ACKVWV_14370 [Planctomycetota bacterium]